MFDRSVASSHHPSIDIVPSAILQRRQGMYLIVAYSLSRLIDIGGKHRDYENMHVFVYTATNQGT